MAKSGLARIDSLFSGAPAAPIGPGDSDKVTVGAIQELLHGHGMPKMPSPVAPDYGIFGDHTKAAVQSFAAANGLGASAVVDSPMMQALISVPARQPIASRPYVTLALDFDWSGMTKIVLVTSILEGQGAFGAMNLNTDRAGMSFGLIQWAQRPMRLNEILQAFHAAGSDLFVTIFGAGDPAVAAGLLVHTAKPNGGLDHVTGTTTDPSFALTDDSWTPRFVAASLDRSFQQTQVSKAIDAFQKSFTQMRAYAPEFVTERAVAFMLDVANQFGDAGLKSLYQETTVVGQTVEEHLAAIADTSVSRIAPDFQAGTRNRRDLFLKTDLLSDANF